MATALISAIPRPVTTSRSFVAISPEDPGIPSAAYRRMEPRWEKCRALMIGTEAIRDGEETYLPRFPVESDTSYANRVQRAALFPAFSRTVMASVGMLLQQEPVLGKDMPQALQDLAEDIDGAGTHWIVFCSELALHAIVDGMDGILVDHLRPEDVVGKPGARTSAAADVPGARLDAADEEALGLRPYWVLFKIDDVIKPIYEIGNGVRTLVVLSLRQAVEERVGSFGVQGVVQYRVYTNKNEVVSYELWREPAGGGMRKRTEGPIVLRNITRIPWAPLIAGQRVSDSELMPPLIHLADLNIEHHQTKTNMLNLEGLGCVPTPVRIGAQRITDPNDPLVLAGEAQVGDYPPITLGPEATIEAPFMEGVSTPFYWTSPDVSVLSPAQATLDRTEGAMSREGGAFLAPDPNGVEAVETKRIKGAAQRATLSTVARALQDCLELAWGYTGEFMKLKAGSVSVSRDFEQAMLSPDEMVAYIDAVDRAGLPIRILTQAWQKGGRIADDVDLDELDQEMMLAVIAKRKQAQLDAQAQADRLAGGAAA